MDRWPRSARVGFGFLVGTSIMINALVLVQPLYMLQIYDRVLTSGSLETLLFLSIAAALAVCLLGLVDMLRALAAGRLSVQLEKLFAITSFNEALARGSVASGDCQPLRDLQAIRSFTAGRGAMALLDLPFVPLFVGALFLIHPHFFWLTLLGACTLGGLTLVNHWWSKGAAREAATAQMQAFRLAQAFTRGAEAIQAMGMAGSAANAWGRDELRAVRAGDRLNSINAVFSGAARALRLALQMAILGYGSFLVLDGQLTAGMIFAASLISGRALQPIDQVIGAWKSLTDVAGAWTRLHIIGRAANEPVARTRLPAPRGALSVEDAVTLRPGTDKPLLKRVSFDLPAGSSLAVVGRSGAGKSTLMRVLIGAVDLRAGAVRIDGSDTRHWNREELGRHIGYVAQDVDLYPGTVGENIARFDPAKDDFAVLEAAERAGIHDFIQRLPSGYDTVLGPGGWQLSGGQRQRMGLARALYGEPRLLIMDEPNAHLDSGGDAALGDVLARARREGVTVVIVTQRRSVIDEVDYILVLEDGAIEQFGPRLDVFRQRMPQAQAA
ncbi:type I secretion system permease/ATPase [Tianweitania sediminis]|nr:type I secretion system permease/ATPase [Tianweitania sediminis]